MISYQCLRTTRLVSSVAKTLLLQNGRKSISKQIIRKSHGGEYYYRKPPPSLCEKKLFGDTLVGAFIWWWILWHCFTSYHELIGISFPDPSKWTDEELGIPPEEE